MVCSLRDGIVHPNPPCVNHMSWAAALAEQTVLAYDAREESSRMNALSLFKILAALVLFLQLPVPVYWFVVHPPSRFFRGHKVAALIFAAIFAWVSGAAFLYWTRDYLFAPQIHRLGLLFGLGFIAVEIILFFLAKRDLGAARLIGATELSGGGEIIATGVYARIRNPRYLGSFFAIIGACLIAATRWMWVTAAVWCLLMFAAILLEEREMRTRFGAVFDEYCRRVPRFIPRFSSPATSETSRTAP
jgi:protein-S-isoprenylcysteine O-methyltransferase Ste14